VPAFDCLEFNPAAKEVPMNHYETAFPRVALVMAAVAMTAITLGVSVILPANMESSRGDLHLAAWKAAPPHSMDVTRIEVVATRAALVGPVPCRLAKSNRDLEG
jgi:hypothetical protein